MNVFSYIAAGILLHHLIGAVQSVLEGREYEGGFLLISLACIIGTKLFLWTYPPQGLIQACGLDTAPTIPALVILGLNINKYATKTLYILNLAASSEAGEVQKKY